jgi:hypothetical protein
VLVTPRHNEKEEEIIVIVYRILDFVPWINKNNNKERAYISHLLNAEYFP